MLPVFIIITDGMHNEEPLTRKSILTLRDCLLQRVC